MKSALLICFFGLISLLSEAQPPSYEKAITRRFPFQTLYALSTTSDSEVINSLDLLNANQVIKVQNGHLILVHFTGKFLEFKGDQLINVNELNKGLMDNNGIDYIKLRPDLSLLRKKATSAVKKSFSQSYVRISNFKEQGEIRINDPSGFCLKWQSSSGSHGRYTITLKDALREQVDVFRTKKNQLAIDFNKYPNNYAFFVTVTESNSGLTSDEEIIRITKISLLQPQSCSVQTAIGALELAYHIERHPNLVQEAEQYYQLASKLSNLPFYAQMHKNYLARRRSQ